MDNIEHYKKGGKVKQKAKATATATNTVHVHLTKRGGSRPNRIANASQRQSLPSLAGGNLALERQFARMFQSLGNMIPTHNPMHNYYEDYKTHSAIPNPSQVPIKQPGTNIMNLADLDTSYTIHQLNHDRLMREQFNSFAHAPSPLIEQDSTVLSAEQELPEQIHNIYNLSKAHNEQSHYNEAKEQEYAMQEALSHASHLPLSVDHGDPAEIRLLPFSKVSYGDEINTESRMIGDSGSIFHENYPHKQPTSIDISEESITQTRQILPLRSTEEERRIYGVHGYGYAYRKGQTPLSRINPPRRNEQSEYSEGGRLYYKRPYQQGQQGGGFNLVNALKREISE